MFFILFYTSVKRICFIYQTLSLLTKNGIVLHQARSFTFQYYFEKMAAFLNKPK